MSRYGVAGLDSAGTVTTTSQFVSTVVTGTVPVDVTSTTVCPNLNAGMLGGKTFADPGSIGSGTPGSGAFTTVSASGIVTVTNATASTSSSTGAVVVTGGVGIGGALFTAGKITSLAGMTIQGSRTTPSPSGGIYMGEGGTDDYAIEICAGTSTNLAYIDFTRPGVDFGGRIIYNNSAGTFETWIEGVQSNLSTNALTTQIIPFYVSNSTESTNTTTGGLRTAGGLGVVKNVNVGGTLGVAGVVSATNSTASTSASTGAVIVTGGVGIGGALFTGGRITSLGGMTVQGSRGGITPASGGIYMGEGGTDDYAIEICAGTSTNLAYIDFTRPGVDVGGRIIYNNNTGTFENWVEGVQTFATTNALTTQITPLYISNSTQSTSTTTGAIRTAGGMGIVKDLHVGGSITTAGLTLNGSTAAYTVSITSTSSISGLTMAVGSPSTPMTSGGYMTAQTSTTNDAHYRAIAHDTGEACFSSWYNNADGYEALIGISGNALQSGLTDGNLVLESSSGKRIYICPGGTAHTYFNSTSMVTSVPINVSESTVSAYVNPGQFYAPSNTTAGNVSQILVGVNSSATNAASFGVKYISSNHPDNKITLGLINYSDLCTIDRTGLLYANSFINGGSNTVPFKYTAASFTPSFDGNGGAITYTYSSRAGYWTRIGYNVSLYFQMEYSWTTTGGTQYYRLNVPMSGTIVMPIIGGSIDQYYTTFNGVSKPYFPHYYSDSLIEFQDNVGNTAQLIGAGTLTTIRGYVTFIFSD